MQVQSVGLNQSFNARGRRENIDRFLELSDGELQNLAAVRTSAMLNDKKHKRINNAIWMAVPLSAGLGAAALTKGSNALRVGAGLGTAARWGAMFAVIDLAVLGMNAIKNDSKTLTDFDKKHPFLSFLGVMIGSFAALALAGKGFSKLWTSIKPAKQAKLASKMAKMGDKLNASKFLNGLRKTSKNIISKSPKFVKSVGKFTLRNTPFILMLGALSHSFDYSAKRNRTFMNNYMDLKEKQNRLAEARAVEIATAMVE